MIAIAAHTGAEILSPRKITHKSEHIAPAVFSIGSAKDSSINDLLPLFLKNEKDGLLDKLKHVNEKMEELRRHGKYEDLIRKYTDKEINLEIARQSENTTLAFDIEIQMNEIISILMERDGLTYEEAREAYEDTREEMLQSIEDGNLDADEILADNLGLEIDYIFAFI